MYLFLLTNGNRHLPKRMVFLCNKLAVLFIQLVSFFLFLIGKFYNDLLPQRKKKCLKSIIKKQKNNESIQNMKRTEQKVKHKNIFRWHSKHFLFFFCLQILLSKTKSIHSIHNIFYGFIVKTRYAIGKLQLKFLIFEKKLNKLRKKTLGNWKKNFSPIATLRWSIGYTNRNWIDVYHQNDNHKRRYFSIRLMLDVDT